MSLFVDGLSRGGGSLKVWCGRGRGEGGIEYSFEVGKQLRANSQVRLCYS